MWYSCWGKVFLKFYLGTLLSVEEILELEKQVNQNETLKKLHLIDMVVVATDRKSVV